MELLYGGNILSNLANPQTMWTVFFVVAIIIALGTLFLFYHWHRYGTGRLRLIINQIVYTAGIIIILFIAFSIMKSM